MRILLSAYACRPHAGSEPGVGWNWATHLAKRGMEVHVLVAKRNQEPVEAGLQGNSLPNLHFTFVAVPFGQAKKNEAVHYALWQIAALKAARELTKKFRFEITHHVTYASIHVPSQLWRLGIPLIFGPVGGGQTTPSSLLPYFGPEKSKERLRSALTGALKFSLFHRNSLQQMSWILAANRDTLRLVQGLGCNNASLMCDTAISTDYFASKPRKFENRSVPLRLLWVGRMLTRKALPLALDVLKAADTNATLTIAGDGMDPAAVHQMIRDRNLQQRVFWKGTRLTYQELRSAYAKHDAMLFTSLRDSFGSQLLEALAMGLPVITVDLQGARDFVPDDASLKVAVGNCQDTVRNFAHAVERYDRLTPQAKSLMSSKALAFAKTLNWTERAEFTEKLYREILSRIADSQRTSSSNVAALTT
ncbi:MAG: glycosyltransferase [Candidatus Sulfotelmatobacter sp.]